jgi:carboxypeptidase Q
MRSKLFWIAAFAATLAIPIFAQVQEKVDLDAVYRIKDEGLNRSQVMTVMSYLTDVYGPRLTNSPQMKAAAEWTKKKLLEWELVNVKFEPFAFGRGWSNEKMHASVSLDGHSYPLIAYPKAWTQGTNGLKAGEATLAVIQTEADIDKFRGKLNGKYVLTVAARDVPALFEAQATRLTDDQLAARARLNVTAPGQRGGGGGGQNNTAFNRKRMQLYLDEGVAALIEPGTGSGGTVFVQCCGALRDPKSPPEPAQVVMAVEHYNRIVRNLEKNIPVRIEMEIDNKYYDDDLNSFNITAEIPGSDKASEIVMLGGHFDSWHTGTGATDNAAGSAVMMEAVRILKATGLKMRRTVRIGLWNGEEEGLLGSDAYVRDHFGDRNTMILRPDHSKLDVYFNVDTGTGAIRGISLNGNERAAPIFEAWTKPFNNLGMTTVAVGAPRQPPTSIGGTDHTSFEAVGLPGFGFIQDGIEYNTRTHHSNMDVYERIQASDMMKNAVIVAAFVYHAANRDEMIPRKPLHPAPPPAAGQRSNP